MLLLPTLLRQSTGGRGRWSEMTWSVAVGRERQWTSIVIEGVFVAMLVQRFLGGK